MIKTFIKTSAISFTLAVSFLSTPVSADSLSAIQKDNELSFALSGAYPPFNFVNDKGELTGFDVEVGKALGKQVKAEGKPVATAWDGIIAGLVADKYDAIIGSMAITDERLKTVDFSDPYYRSGAQLFVKKESTIADIKSMTGKKIGVTLGTTFEKWVKENAPSVEVKTYKGVPQMFLEMAYGRIDGFITDKLVGIIAINENNAELKMAGDLLYPELVGIAVQKDNKELLEALNKGLSTIQENGEYKAISEKYFKMDIR